MASATTPVDTLLGFSDEFDVPAIWFDYSQESPPPYRANQAFHDTFDTEANSPSDSIIESSSTPIDRFPKQVVATDDLTLHLVECDSTMHLRKRMWTENTSLDMYFEAGSNLPHHRHIAVLHRVLRHNLRNTLNTIRGWTHEIQSVTSDETVQQAADTVYEKSDELLALTAEVSDLEHILYADTEAQPRDIQSVVASTVSECHPRFDTTERVFVDVPADATMFCNEQFDYALYQLIDNALRHTDGPVSIEATVEPDYIEFTVRDTGGGIPQIEQNIITDDSTIDQLNHGSGLGLWIANWIVEMNGGYVSVDTATAAGSTINIILPT